MDGEHALYLPLDKTHMNSGDMHMAGLDMYRLRVTLTLTRELQREDRAKSMRATGGLTTKGGEPAEWLKRCAQPKSAKLTPFSHQIKYCLYSAGVRYPPSSSPFSFSFLNTTTNASVDAPQAIDSPGCPVGPGVWCFYLLCPRCFSLHSCPALNCSKTML